MGLGESQTVSGAAGPAGWRSAAACHRGPPPPRPPILPGPRGRWPGTVPADRGRARSPSGRSARQTSGRWPHSDRRPRSRRQTVPTGWLAGRRRASRRRVPRSSGTSSPGRRAAAAARHPPPAASRRRSRRRSQCPARRPWSRRRSVGLGPPVARPPPAARGNLNRGEPPRPARRIQPEAARRRAARPRAWPGAGRLGNGISRQCSFHGGPGLVSAGLVGFGTVTRQGRRLMRPISRLPTLPR